MALSTFRLALKGYNVANYGEELAYWYFRLNGFVPMSNFVLHQDGKVGSDCDLIAIRFPYVYEKVGGSEEDWDSDLLKQLGGETGKTLVTFVQVKAGAQGGAGVHDLKEYFEAHCEALVHRAGLWPTDEASHIAQKFKSVPNYEDANYVLSKITLIDPIRARHNAVPWIDWSLNKAGDFINLRMEKYAAIKYRDRFHFSSELIQYLAHQAHRKEAPKK